MLLTEGRERLAALGDAARLEAELLLAHALDRPRSHLRAWPERPVDARDLGHYRALLAARAEGAPVAYLTGSREFWSLELAVTPRTLVPRPDTERLVELALERLPGDSRATVTDLGTGSGAIALALARERPGLTILATDRDAETLRVARGNAARHDLANVHFAVADWCAPLPAARFEAVLSNPPYVASGDPHLVGDELRFEPRAALVAGEDGLDDLRRLVSGARRCLVPGGHLLLEHGFDQAEAVRELLDRAGYVAIADHRDHAGQPRVASARAPDGRTVAAPSRRG
ncbi:MAG: peptide chain release factor N(5)-glutamine methyltransferase [Gammaproteobacteria bacterium]|nr:peptide chain release factor N(5)-glutamine methyltransferase [Gammaproteobacteria bacterium]